MPLLKRIQLDKLLYIKSGCLCRVQKAGNNAVIEALRLNEPTNGGSRGRETLPARPLNSLAAMDVKLRFWRQLCQNKKKNSLLNWWSNMLLLCPFVALVVTGNLLKCNFIINDRTLRGKGKKKKKRMFNRRAKNGELPLFPLVPVSWLAATSDLLYPDDRFRYSSDAVLPQLRIWII